MEARRSRGRGGVDAAKADVVNVQSSILKVFTSNLGVEGERQEVIAVRKFEVEPAYVRVNAGVTKNMGNYESLRIDVSLSVPCYVEEMDTVFPKVADMVAAYLDIEKENYTAK
jgi:hypothetical protein